MINNWKLGLKSLRYAHGRLSNGIVMVVFFLMGILYFCLWRHNTSISNTFFGGYMLTCTGLMPIQMIYSLSASNLVQTSPAKKKMQTSVPATISCCNMMVIYLVTVLVRGIIIYGHPELTGIMGNELIIQALLMLVMMAYVGIAYKYFAISIVGFLFFYFMVYTGTTNNIMVWDIFVPSIPSYLLAALIGLALVVVGGFVQYGVSLLVYKAPMSKMSQAATLRKEL